MFGFGLWNSGLCVGLIDVKSWIGSFEISILKFYSHGGPLSSDWVAKFIKCQPGVIKTQTRWYLAAPILTTTLKSSDFFQLKPDVMGLNSHHSGLYFYIIVFNWSPWWCFFEEFYATGLPVFTAMRIQYIIKLRIHSNLNSSWLWYLYIQSWSLNLQHVSHQNCLVTW